MIRPATLGDIPALLEMGKAFADEAGVTARVGWDDDSVAEMLEGLILSDDGIVLVSERGMIGGYVAAHPFNRNARLFAELFWRSEDGQGLALLKAAEAQAEARGATKSVMVAMDGMERTQRLYGRLGYAPCEMQFIKDIG
jgi:GNAT superfamily N-acetyltransferase